MRLHLGCGQRHLEGDLNIDFARRAVCYLRHFLLDAEASEMRIHAVWMSSFSEQLDKGWAQ